MIKPLVTAEGENWFLIEGRRGMLILDEDEFRTLCGQAPHVLDPITPDKDDAPAPEHLG